MVQGPTTTSRKIFMRLLRWSICLRGALSYRDPIPQTPLLESQAFWGAIALICQFVGFYIAWVLKDFRWALYFAMPLCWWAIFIASRHIRAARLIRWLVRIVTCIAVVVVIVHVDRKFSPKGEVGAREVAKQQIPPSVRVIQPTKQVTQPSPKIRTLKLTFTNSPALTTVRREKILDQMEAFSAYLASIGFAALEALPPIGTSRGKVQHMVFMSPGSAYDNGIFIAEQSIDDAAAIRTAYASYYFDVTLGGFGGDVEMAGRSEKIQLAGVYEVYFLESYIGRHIKSDSSSILKWVDALWDIRNTFGKEITDKALFVGAMRRRGQIVKIVPGYTGEVITSGLYALVNDKAKDLKKVHEILAAHGLMEGVTP
jgi:hypothetical protein